MKLTIYPEECCDYCGEIIHNHFDCPVCNEKYAGTESYHAIWEVVLEISPYLLECQECGAAFELINTGNGSLDDYEWSVEK